MKPSWITDFDSRISCVDWVLQHINLADLRAGEYSLNFCVSRSLTFAACSSSVKVNEGVNQWYQSIEKHLWGEQGNLSTRKTVNGPVLCSPNIMRMLTVVGLW